MIKWAGQAKRELMELKGKQKTTAHTDYKRWVDSQLRSGAGTLHAITKRSDPPLEGAVCIFKAKAPTTVHDEQEIANQKRKAKAVRAKKIATLACSQSRQCHRCPTIEIQ